MSSIPVMSSLQFRLHRQNNKLSSHKLPPNHQSVKHLSNKLCKRPPQYAAAPCKLTFDLLTLKVVSKSRVTWVTSLPILVFLGLSVLDLGPMYTTDSSHQMSDAHHRLMPLPDGGEGITNKTIVFANSICQLL